MSVEIQQTTEPSVDIEQRKVDHIDLCATGDVGFMHKTNLFEEVELVHDALPELHLDRIDTRIELLGKTLEAPIVIAAMTGGTEKARSINRELARIADERGYGFGLGSQRAMMGGEASRVSTYEIRDLAPTALVLGNIGGVQARSMPTAQVHELCTNIGADALCVHLNPAMELVQPGGDRDFAGVLATLERLVNELPLPVVAKETGCGFGPRAAHRLAQVGVKHLDLSGAGGTSWVAVETARAAGSARSLGELLRDWGVPTAASVLITRRVRPRFQTIIATGGMRTGLDIARAIALGAHAGGIARPVLQALMEGGRDGAMAMLDRVEQELKSAMLLVGARDVASLRRADYLLGARLRRWNALAKRAGKRMR